MIISSDPMYFCGVSCNLSLLIYDFIYLSLLSLFLSVVKDLITLLTFQFVIYFMYIHLIFIIPTIFFGGNGF
jgi:hypothetical protein